VSYEPSPYNTYYYYEASTESYVEYEPTPVQWTDFYEVPTVELYTNNNWTPSSRITTASNFPSSSSSYSIESEPSPYTTYWFFDESTQTFSLYEPSPVEWTKYYELPPVDLYSFDQPTQEFYTVSEPNPYTSYFYYSEESQSYIPYEPT
jgi:hypothetical protein